MGINKNIVCAAVLQELAQPYSLIYVDTVNRALYLAVRISSPDVKEQPVYLAAPTSREEIKAYMEEKKSLEEIFSQRSTFEFIILNGEVKVEPAGEFPANKTFRAMNWFDPEFCEEEDWIEVFLKRHEAGKAFELA